MSMFLDLPGPLSWYMLSSLISVHVTLHLECKAKMATSMDPQKGGLADTNRYHSIVDIVHSGVGPS